MRSTAGRARPDHGMMQVGGGHVASFEQRDETQPRYDRAIISYLTAEESDALLAAPDRAPWHGRRDHALLVLDCQTGLRVSELTGLNCGDAHPEAGAHIRCHGKGRKDRATPLTKRTAGVLKVWLSERSGHPHDPLFPTCTGERLSRDAVARLVAKHAATAAAVASGPRCKRRTGVGS